MARFKVSVYSQRGVGVSVPAYVTRAPDRSRAGCGVAGTGRRIELVAIDALPRRPLRDRQTTGRAARETAR